MIFGLVMVGLILVILVVLMRMVIFGLLGVVRI